MATYNVNNGTPQLFYSSIKDLKKAMKSKAKQLMIPLVGRIIIRAARIFGKAKGAAYLCKSFSLLYEFYNFIDLKQALKEYKSKKGKHSIEGFYSSLLESYQDYKTETGNLLSDCNALRQKYLKQEESMPDTATVMRQTVNKATKAFRNCEHRYIALQVLLKGLSELSNTISEYELLQINNDIRIAIQQMPRLG